MPQEKLILAVDLGTSGMKVSLITVSGKVIGWESEPVRLIITSDGGAEQSPEEWWQAFLSAARRLIKRQPDAAPGVSAVCCSTQGEGTLAVDSSGKALGNALLWMDMRGAPYLREQIKGTINVRGVGISNLVRFIRLTGGTPSMTGKDPAAHMLFIRDALPEMYARTYKFLNVLDYMNLRLTGEFVASFDSIVTSWVTDNRNPDTVHYDNALIHSLGLDRLKLPDVVPCSKVIGCLRRAVAEVLGLSSDVKVVAGAIDNTAAAIGAGTVEDYLPHLYIGTSSWIAAHVPFKKTDIFSNLASIPCAVPGRYLLTALQATAGGNLAYLRDNILYHKDALLQEAEVPDIFKVMDQIAKRVPEGEKDEMYTHWNWGESEPVEERKMRA
ncbi:MAG: xylulose kinase, partial [Chloroflexi bacterium]